MIMTGVGIKLSIQLTTKEILRMEEEMKSVLKRYFNMYTDISEAMMEDILNKLLIRTYSKGSILLKQGDQSQGCFFILKGCIRQYCINEEGRETTVNFYMEEDSICIFNQGESNRRSKYYLECLEDCVLVVGDIETESQMYKEHPELLMMTQMMVQKKLGTTQDTFSILLSSSHEERVQYIMENWPELFERVAQYQLASYLGMTPESLSRIKTRLIHQEEKGIR